MNSPNHGFASFGFTWSRRIIFWCIFRSPFATMPAEGRSLICTFSNRDCWQNLSCKLSAALSSSLKKPFTLLITSPVENFSKQLRFCLNKSWTKLVSKFHTGGHLGFFCLPRGHLEFYQVCSATPSCTILGGGGGLAPQCNCVFIYALVN